MLLSCIVPIYNRESSLPVCVESLLNIKSNDVEVLLVDDGSSDGSLSICKRYEQKDCRIHTVHQENRGVGAARNKGIDLSKGDFLMFIDSDDTIVTETIEYFLKIQQYDKDFYCFDYYINNSENYQKRILQEKPDCGLLHSFLYQNNNAVWNNIYKASVIKRNNILFDTTMKMGEDLLFNITFIQKIKNWEYINRPIYIYKDNTVGSAVNTYKFSLIENYMKMFEELYPYYIKTDFKRYINWIDYLNGIFINIFSTTENRNKKVFDELEQSKLYKEISDASMTSLKMKFKLFCVKYKLYRRPLIAKLVKKLFY